jgi:hypothetical protein
LSGIEDQIIPLLLDNPRKTTSQEESYLDERFQSFVEGLNKETLQYRKGLPRAKIASFWQRVTKKY